MKTHARILVLLLTSTTLGLILGCDPATDDGGEKNTDATPVATTGDAWGEMPTQVNPFYFTDFDQWVGKPLADQELARLINRPIPEALKTGRGFVMFFRSDCEHCHHMLEQWFTESVPAPTVAVLVDDTDPANAMPFPSTIVERKALPRGPDYVIQTPALFAVKDGVVTGFASDPDDVASVEACIASNEN
ncbi:MAG: hypothetical protein CBB69_013385 [Phycisphaera sp. TMED9]|nr:MAG: hypothetical protein CBB69_013385 [Phycisphaera sp. TMED9]